MSITAAAKRKRAEWLCSLIFSAVAIAWMQAPAAAFSLRELGFSSPGLDYATLFFRGYFMRYKPTAIGALALGALADLYTACPLGVHMLTYYGLNFCVKRMSDTAERIEYRSWIKTAFITLCAVVCVESLFLSALYGQTPPFAAMAARCLLTLAAYPVVHLLMRGFAASGGDGGPAPQETAHKPPVRAIQYLPEEQVNFAP